MDINNENLENALNNSEAQAPETSPQAAPEQAAPQMPREMEIGFHQGALNTLAAERQELYNMIQNVEKIMGLHMKRLEELGVKIQQKTE